MSVLLSIFGFLAMLGMLIFIHELGHFLAAKIFGVRVDVFSLGFVGRIVSFRWGETRYQVGWLPLGGYVKMLGEQGEGALPRELQARSFSHKPLWQRALIVLAGPLANILVLPIGALALIYAFQVNELSTVVGSVIPGYPAARAKLQAGDRIDAVDGYRTRYFRDLLYAIGRSANRPVTLKVTRGAKTLEVKLTPQVQKRRNPLEGMDQRGVIGVTAGFRHPDIGIANPESAAYRAGLRTWDRIVAVNGKPIQRWQELVRFRAEHPAGPHRYTVKRPLLFDGPLLHYRRWLPTREITVQPKKVRQADGSFVYKDGIAPSELFVSYVRKGTPMERVGLRPGDRLISLAGKKLQLTSDLESLPNRTDRTYSLMFERAGKVHRRTFRLYSMKWMDPLKQKHDRVVLGVHLSPSYADGILTPVTDRVPYMFKRAVYETWMLSGLLVKVLKKLFTREISSEHIGGPIMIFQIAEKAVKSGWEVFLRHMALISINLGLINLLPIPLLDGGHLLFFGIEAVIRRPIPQRVKESALLLGLLLLLMLLLLAVKNDLQRVFGG